MIKRLLKTQLAESLARYPATNLVGPRQVGKTTLAKALSGEYFDLENPQDRLRLDIAWERLVHEKRMMILDEAQAMPEIFPRLRSVIDEDRKRNGRFLLLGSISPVLMKTVGESLTGRLALCELSPFLMREVKQNQGDNLWRLGGYPDGGILKDDQFPHWQHNYLTLMAQRDFPEWGLNAQPSVTQRLFRMLAAVHGQMWNASQIGQSLGLSYHTVNAYVDFLENVFLIRRLPAYSVNIRKRFVKSPKVYWRDSGLLHSLLGVESESLMWERPWVGDSWEGWVIEQILTHLQSTGKSFQAFYLRTSDQRECDLILEYRGRLWAFEIKLSSTPDVHDLKRLRETADLVGADHAILISRTNRPIQSEKEASLNLGGTLDWLLD